jgi:hypothetical protein
MYFYCANTEDKTQTLLLAGQRFFLFVARLITLPINLPLNNTKHCINIKDIYDNL